VADPRGFLEVQRRLGPLRAPLERLGDYRDVHLHAPEDDVRGQARRCMSCGVPFCHTGCPLGNLIPDWNDLVHRGHWQEASERLHSTNNFPELTGKLCPAPCEEACVLTINDDAVTIKEIEWAIVERAWEAGWIVPQPAGSRSGYSAGVIGSGPAGLAAAQQLARAGHAVTVYERDDRAGGLLRYGIPDFKLEKDLIDRRVDQLGAEGVEFAYGVAVGSDVPFGELRARHDALVLATGAQAHRRLALPGAELAGVHLAMEYLVQQNRRVAGLPVAAPELSARGLRVAILGGGDTSADCLGNVLREGCVSVVEIAHGPTPPRQRDPQRTWPEWPFLLRTYPAHEEGGEREWQLETIALEGEDGRVRRLRARRVEFPGFAETGRRQPLAVPGGEVVLDVDLVLVAVGFSGVERGDPLYGQLGLELGPRETVPVDETFATAVPGLFAAGDCVRGADLIVQAIADGREAARALDLALQGASALPSRVAI
jgi:glutamate synthase (NADPH/NADH) small chain